MSLSIEGQSAPAARLSRSVVGRLARTGRSVQSALLAPAYALYTRRLRHEVEDRVLPQHVAVILDGNRRWASISGAAEPAVGHRAGADKLDELIDWCVRPAPTGELATEEG